jgi:hypothetical protein
MLELLQKDEVQLNRDAKALLVNANCFSPKDKAFIYSVIDKNFDSREDMVNTIKAFIKSMRSQGHGAAGAGLVTTASGGLAAPVNPLHPPGMVQNPMSSGSAMPSTPPGRGKSKATGAPSNPMEMQLQELRSSKAQAETRSVAGAQPSKVRACRRRVCLEEAVEKGRVGGDTPYSCLCAVVVVRTLW